MRHTCCMLTVHQEQDQRGFQELFSHLTVSLTVQSSISKARGFWFESKIKGAFWNKRLFHLLEKGWIVWQNTFWQSWFCLGGAATQKAYPNSFVWRWFNQNSFVWTWFSRYTLTSDLPVTRLFLVCEVCWLVWYIGRVGIFSVDTGCLANSFVHFLTKDLDSADRLSALH